MMATALRTIFGPVVMRKRRVGVVVILALGCLLLLAYGSSLSSGRKLKGFPILTQSDAMSCGPTACTMVLNYYGRSVSIPEVKERTRTSWYHNDSVDIGMTVPQHIQVALNDFGVPSSLGTSTWEELVLCVDQKRPAVVLLRSGPALWHYGVVIGYRNDCLIVADPSGKERTLQRDSFLASWEYAKDLTGNDAPSFDPYRRVVEFVTGLPGRITIIPDRGRD